MLNVIICLSILSYGIDVNAKISGWTSEGIQCFLFQFKLASSSQMLKVTYLEIKIPYKKKKKTTTSSNWTSMRNLFWILQIRVLLQAKYGFHSDTTKLVNIFRSLEISRGKKQKIIWSHKRSRSYSHLLNLRRRITCRHDPTIKSGRMKS